MTATVTIALILDTARRMIPGLVAAAHRADATPQLLASLPTTVGFIGIVSGRPRLSLFIEMKGVGRWILTFERPALPLSDQEWEVLGRLPDALATSLSLPSPRRHRVAHQIATRLSLEHVLVAQVLRKTRAAGFWWPMVILESLIELTFRRYEGQPAATGVVFTSRDELYSAGLGTDHPYILTRFAEPLSPSYDMFASPASFRYVDGRNSFYLLNRKHQLIGVLRAKQPSGYSIIDRCSLEHVRPLVAHMAGRVWLAHVGLNRDVHVLRSGGVHLHWQDNHWRIRDDGLVRSLLLSHGCKPDTTGHLLSLLNALSELRLGALVLIPHDNQTIPPSIGKIDVSPVARLLRDDITATSIEQLIRSHTAIGVLSSDGLTTISKTGQLLSCGDIVDLGGVPQSSFGGGGRSQAGRAASQFGLAIKVSEDGPITVFVAGQPVVSI